MVLVVEEDAGVRRFLEAVLSTHGFDVRLATNGRDGLRVFGNGVGFDMVLMDVHMLDLDGADTLRLMQQVCPGVTCAFMTGDTSLNRWQELIDIGARHVFSKPFSTIHEFISKVHELLNAGRTAGGE